MINVRSLYNNPKYSDILIELRDGTTLYAHKLVLAQRSSVFARLIEAQSSARTIQLATHAAEVVKLAVLYMYGNADHTSAQRDITRTQWIDLYGFARAYEVDIVEVVLANMPACVKISDMAELGYVHKDTSLMSMVITMLNNNVHNESIDPVTLKSVASLEWDEFAYLTDAWTRAPLPSFSLLVVGSHYCNAQPESIQLSTFGTFIQKIDTSRISSDDLRLAASHLPIISTTPLIACLFKRMADMKDNRI